MKTLRIAVDLEDDHVQLKQIQIMLNADVMKKKSLFKDFNIDKYEDKICCWQLNSKYFMNIHDKESSYQPINKEYR